MNEIGVTGEILVAHRFGLKERKQNFNARIVGDHPHRVVKLDTGRQANAVIKHAKGILCDKREYGVSQR